MKYLGIEIGGTKLQLAIGSGNGHLDHFWRTTIIPANGATGILNQIEQGFSEILRQKQLQPKELSGVGIGFGGPIDDTTRSVIKSHQVQGWDEFPLADWAEKKFGLPCEVGNDADVAGLAEACHGAGKGYDSIFYMTIGSGIGGGMILNQNIYRGVGRGAAEVGHLKVADFRDGRSGFDSLENIASGWGISKYAWERLSQENGSLLKDYYPEHPEKVNPQSIARAAEQNELFSQKILAQTLDSLAWGIASVIVLLCPHRIIIGGGVSLIGENLFFAPLRERVQKTVFPPFKGLTEIVPAQLGEEVVLHGAIEMIKRKKVTALN
jgi:glucokinase